MHRIVLIHTRAPWAGLYQICGCLEVLGVQPDALPATATCGPAWPRSHTQITAALTRVTSRAVYYRELPAQADALSEVAGDAVS